MANGAVSLTIMPPLRFLDTGLWSCRIAFSGTSTAFQTLITDSSDEISEPGYLLRVAMSWFLDRHVGSVSEGGSD